MTYFSMYAKKGFLTNKCHVCQVSITKIVITLNAVHVKAAMM